MHDVPFKLRVFGLTASIAAVLAVFDTVASLPQTLPRVVVVADAPTTHARGAPAPQAASASR